MRARKTAHRRLRILVSNDDGIAAPGISALVLELKKIGDVTVVAPDKQRSAVGHAITVNYPLRAAKYFKNDEFFGYAIEGTPADCVKLAIRSLLDEKPDILVSGINHGSNTAINIIYSGTVSAATEGTVLGIPSIAVSLATWENPDFTFAAKISRKLTEFVATKGLPEASLLNVNV
ncbi:MAG TPA: 5'/3'-nucleotidase SurE, partial [Bacteroidota bacterium]|nr:5'/3'-nucleotidase SurE [Bacteroidota bacterium]